MGGLAFLAERVDAPLAVRAPERRMFAGAGVAINALDWGGEGPPVVFLHGGALSAHTWDYVCTALRGSFRCVALDLRGHGDSGWAESYRVSDYAADVVNVIEALGFERPHLVGMSLGGVAAAYACVAARAFAPASLTLVDVAPGVDFSASARLREFIGGGAVQGGVQGLIAEARRIGARGDDAALFYRYATLIRQDETGAWRWKRDGRRPPDFAHILSHLEALGEHAARFSWPVLLVRGGESRILSDAAAAAFVSRCPDARLAVVERAGHSVQEDNPRALAEALRAFWASLEQ